MANQRLATADFSRVEAPPANLVELLQFWARHHGDRAAYTFQRDDGHEATIDYATLDRRARAIAAHLQQTCERGDRALLLFPAGLDFIAAFCGCAYAGVLAVPVCYPKPKRPMPRLMSIAQDAQPRVALTNRKTLEQFDFHHAQAGLANIDWIASDDSPDAMADAWAPLTLSGDDIAFLQYTSGSTSDPKGVMVSHGNLLHNLEVIRQGFGLDFDFRAGEPRNKGVFWLPAYHDMGLIGGILTAMYVGGHSLLMSPSAFLQRPYRWLETISETRATISGAPNFAFDLCVKKIPAEKRRQLDLSGWEVCFCGAEPIRAETLDAFANAFRESGFRGDTFYPCYGLAENTLMAAGGDGPSHPQIKVVLRDALAENRIVEADASSGQLVQELVCCGKPVLDQEIAIVDPESGLRRADAEVGEIWIKGRSVACGYWNRPDETERTFRAFTADNDGPYLRTGDLGFLDQGWLYVTGRVKDVIIIRGRNHYPHDIECTVERAHAALRPHAGVAVAIDVQGEESLVIIHEVDRAYRDVDLGEVTRCIRRAVAEEHEINPYAIVLIRHASLPVTTSGKVQRSLARRLYLAGELKVLEEWVAPYAASPALLRRNTLPGTTKSHSSGNGHVNGNGHSYVPGDRNSTASADHRNAASCVSKNGNGHSKYANGRHYDALNTNGHGNGSHLDVAKNNAHGNVHVVTNLTANGAGTHTPSANDHEDTHSSFPTAASPTSSDGRAQGAGNANGHAGSLKTPKLHFDHFPLSAEEIDRLAERIEKWILDWLVERAAIHTSEIDPHKPFAEYGLDSLTAVELSHELESWLGVELTAVVAWNYPTPHKISQYLARKAGGAEMPDDAPVETSAEVDTADDFERLLAEIESLSESEAQDALSRDDSSA